MKTTPAVASLLLALSVSACSREASHLPSPLALPGAWVGSVVGNATYNARRNRVKQYVLANYAAIRAEARVGQGAHLDEAMHIAGIKPAKRVQVRAELKHEFNRYFLAANAASPDVEPVVVVLMVHA